MPTTRRTRIGITLAVIMIAGAGTLASEDTYGTVTVHVDSITPALSMDSWADPYDSSWYSGNTGQFNLTLSNATAGVPELYGQAAFCLEVETVSVGNTISYNLVDLQDGPVSSGPADTSQGPMAMGKADAMRELWARHAAEISSNITAAAFQLCVWELVYEDLYVTSPPGWNVLSGKFRSQADAGTDAAAAITQANQWLASIDGTGPKAQLYALSLDGTQDMVIAPEPTALSLIGLGGLAMRMRRRRRI